MRRKREGGADANWHPPLPAFHQVSSYARLATDERHTGRVGIVAIGVPSGASSMDALGWTSVMGECPSITLMIEATAASVMSFRGHSTVVRPSVEALRWSWLPNPRIDRSAGTERSRSAAAWKTPGACESSARAMSEIDGSSSRRRSAAW